MDKKTQEVLDNLPFSVCKMLEEDCNDSNKNINEIRLRVGQPIQLFFGGKRKFLESKGIFSKALIEQTLMKMCGDSLYSVESSINDGFLTLKGGHRVGLVGTAYGNGKNISVSNISSMNIRISREHENCSSEIYEKVFDEGLKNLLIIGEPLSGKTTIIRDLARKLSETSGYRVALIDERNEIASTHLGENQHNVGKSCDILTGYSKDQGMRIAIRGLSPEVIVCDELAGENDIETLNQCINSGAKIVATIHGEISKNGTVRHSIEELLQSKIFDYVVFLSGRNYIGQITNILKVN